MVTDKQETPMDDLVTISLRVPRERLVRLDERARRERRSRNSEMLRILDAALTEPASTDRSPAVGV